MGFFDNILDKFRKKKKKSETSLISSSKVEKEKFLRLFVPLGKKAYFCRG